MRAIEVDAGARFRAVGLDAIANDDPPAAAVLLTYVADGRAWLAERNGELVGYATASVVDGEGHLDQVSVLGLAAGHGIGALLVDRVCRWAADAGYHAVSLTTFRDVPWNGPYYQRLGFVEIPEHGCGPELRAIRRAERHAGLDVRPRIAMRKVLQPET
ncbi:MAG: GNAT family N-acetyltransferase [Acidimicrobiales bacterium]